MKPTNIGYIAKINKQKTKKGRERNKPAYTVSNRHLYPPVRSSDPCRGVHCRVSPGQPAETVSL